MKSGIKTFKAAYRLVKRINFTWLITFLLIFNFLISNANVSMAQVPDDCMANDVYKGGCTDIKGDTNSTIKSLVAIITVPEHPTSATAFRGGALYQIANLSDTLYVEPPASAIVWAQDQVKQIVGRESILVNAQKPEDTSTYFPGLGFDVLRPVLGLWTWTRNIAYGFFIVILIVIAFMILFRQSLGGQAVVTIANSLPSVILALVLVTLSYPLSAVFVDFVYIGSGFLQSVMFTAPGAPGAPVNGQGGITTGTTPSINSLQPDDQQMSIWGIWGLTNANVCDNDEDCSLNSLLPEGVQKGTGPIGDAIGVFTNLVSGVQAIGGNSLLKLLLALIALGATIKLFLALLNNYIIMTTMPIFAPFIFLTTAIPGRGSAVIGSYFKMLLASALVFIVIHGVFLLLVLIGTSNSNELFGGAFESSAEVRWVPPLLGYTTDQIAGGLYRTLLIYAVFLFSPSIPDYIKGNLGVPTGNVFFQAVMQRSQAGFGVVNEARKRITSYLPGTGEG